MGEQADNWRDWSAQHLILLSRQPLLQTMVYSTHTVKESWRSLKHTFSSTVVFTVRDAAVCWNPLANFLGLVKNKGYISDISDLVFDSKIPLIFFTLYRNNIITHCRVQFNLYLYIYITLSLKDSFTSETCLDRQKRCESNRSSLSD